MKKTYNNRKKDWRKSKTGGKAVSHSCRNNGNCPWCTSNRTIKNKKRIMRFSLKENSE